MAWARASLLAVVLVAVALPVMAAAVNWSRLMEPWPDPAALADIPGTPVSWASSSPFAPDDIGDPGEAPTTTALGRLYLPQGPHEPRSIPAVILLHGSGGVLASRELTYAPQLARMGVAALVVDSFGARRDRGTEFIERVLNITETMMLADAYSGLGFLATRPEIDPRRVVLTGFSYGAMATMYALYAQIADKLSPTLPTGERLRFAGHAAFYGPCIARFDDSRTTGAPLLMLLGGKDQITDQRRCAEVADDLRRGGSPVETIVYPEAVHQWDGAFAPRLIGRNLAGCSFRVEHDGTIRDTHTGLAMSGPFRRKIILGLCTLGAGPYPIGRDDRVRAQASLDYGRFLASVFAAPPRP
ncbi:MAG: dienelactone hydrolase family protein [Alphaproteobacteria bacterium]|nr:dienelactone hydrolase family protein [Alphaproteobacteria bacterium]